MTRLASLLLSVLFVASGALAGPADSLEAVRARFAPDRRLTVFDVTVDQQQEQTVARGEVESLAARDAVLQALRLSGHRNLVDRIQVLPDAALGARTFGIVRVSVANVRGKPSHAAEMVTQTLLGWPVRILKEDSGWFLVHTEPDGYLGWIEDLQLTRVTAEQRREWEGASRVILISPYALMREAPSADADPVADLVIGAILQSTGTSEEWTHVLMPDGRRGFVRASEVQDYESWKASRAPMAANIERTAKQFMGVPYLWGGTSAKGFDCSGFAKTVFRLNGIELPRDTDQQAQAGAAVPIDDRFSQLQRGDLLFFGSAATADRPARVTHVGIYLANGEFIHESGLVRRNSLLPSSPIYSESHRRRLLQVRRVLPPPTGITN
jgi:cell wall-associated NlpC family hydrolase